MKNGKPDIITLLVDNEFGVLTRVTALIRREGLNIRSLAVAETDDTAISRMTVCIESRHGAIDHVLGRLRRLSSVLEVESFSAETQLARELCLVRVEASDPEALEDLATLDGVTLLECDGGCALLSAQGEPKDIDSFVLRCRELGLADISRTGVLTMARPVGSANPKEDGPDAANTL